jgi:hypothetical protein
MTLVAFGSTSAKMLVPGPIDEYEIEAHSEARELPPSAARTRASQLEGAGSRSVVNGVRESHKPANNDRVVGCSFLSPSRLHPPFLPCPLFSVL